MAPESRRADLRIDTAEIPECLDCGACCFSTLPEYIRVFGIDTDRMDERALGLCHFLGNRLYMKIEDGRCAALAIDPERRRFVCSIYAMRPDVCRSLERGSGGCRADRHEKAARPLLAVEALLRRARETETATGGIRS